MSHSGTGAPVLPTYNPPQGMLQHGFSQLPSVPPMLHQQHSYPSLVRASPGVALPPRHQPHAHYLLEAADASSSLPDMACVPANLLISKMDAIAIKRAELAESPTTRMQFKDFYRQFRIKERLSFEAAKDYAMACFELLPLKVHWKLFLELADLAKRENRIAEARRLYRRVCRLQPHAAQAWLVYSRMEEECGDMERADGILQKGLLFCEYSESLLARALKHAERKGDLRFARSLLSRLRHVSIDKVWRTVLEGALLEARAGNDRVARKVFEYLIGCVPWYGPIYNEAFRLEEKCQGHAAALAIVERGLKEIPRYGPLWFGAFRLCERLDLDAGKDAVARGLVPDLPRTRDMIFRALGSISKELIWKVHFEAAQIEERAASTAAGVRVLPRGGPTEGLAGASLPVPNLDPTGKLTRAETATAIAAIPAVRGELLGRCRQCYVDAALTAPSNLRWKVWLAGARTELGAGRVDFARALLRRAFCEVPDKSKAHVFLECARLEEYVGNVDKARSVLAQARVEARGEWKVFLESVLLEMRAGEWARAIDQARSALSVHTGTGRLWAILVQLRYLGGAGEQVRVLRQALSEVPKSGEVWCEGARIHLSPVSFNFDLELAQRYLDFAIQFTPQYGDSFLELLRLTLVRQVIEPVARSIIAKWDDDTTFGVEGKGNQVVETVDCRVLAPRCPSFVLAVEKFMTTDTQELEMRCSNADPNYGLFWFHCRDLPSDSPRLMMRRAKALLAEDLSVLFPLYLAAILRRHRVEKRVGKRTGSGTVCYAEGRQKADADNFREQRIAEGMRGIEMTTGKVLQDERGSEKVEEESLEPAMAGLDETANKMKDRKGEEFLSDHKSNDRLPRCSSNEELGTALIISEERKNDGKLADTNMDSSTFVAVPRKAWRLNKARIREEGAIAREWERDIQKAMQAEPRVAPRAWDPEGREIVLKPGDFMTGLVGLNRMATDTGSLSNEEKRRLLFGSDQLVP